jgi:Tfp pilus assembly protein PilF
MNSGKHMISQLFQFQSDAKASFSKAIELDPNSAFVWSSKVQIVKKKRSYVTLA